MFKSEAHGRLCAQLPPAFATLLQAFEYADDVGADLWQFAVTIEQLRQIEVSEIDLRWLVLRNYAEHAREVTMADDEKREFRAKGSALFSKRTCFVLTTQGVEKARRVVADHSPTPENDGLVAGNGNGAPSSVGSPRWDSESHELRLAGCTVKRFKWPATNQQMVLSAFEPPPSLSFPASSVEVLRVTVA
jgi:hypothetical protein